MSRPLPYVARENLRLATLYIKAVRPGATDIDFVDAMATTGMHWRTFQFEQKGEMGVATIGALYPGQIGVEHPYTPVMWQYNRPKE